MKKSASLKLGRVYEHLHQILHAEKELVEVTFHYGMGSRVHLDTHQLGIRHGKDLLQGFLNKRPVSEVQQYYLFQGITTSHKGVEGLCGEVLKHLNHPAFAGETYVFVSSNHKSLSCLTQTSTEICVESHHLCEGTYDLPPMSETGAVCVALPPGAFQRLISMPKKKRKKGLKRSLF